MFTEQPTRLPAHDSIDELLLVVITDFHDLQLQLATLYTKLGDITTDLDIIKSNFADQLDQDNARILAEKHAQTIKHQGRVETAIIALAMMMMIVMLN